MTAEASGASFRVHCAWCGRVREGDDWTENRMSTADAVGLSERFALSHGICPACFAELTAGTPYADGEPSSDEIAT